MRNRDILQMSDAEVFEEAKKLLVGYGQKNVIRYDSQRAEGVHAESAAEHVFALIYLAHYFLEFEPSAKNLDRSKVYDILLFHDFGEMKYGDAVVYYKTKEHEEREAEAAKEIFASLPEPLNTSGYEGWQEYTEHTTPEGKFCYALNKIEPLFELMDQTPSTSMKRLKITKEMNVENKYTAAKNYPFMLRFVDVLSKDMVARDIFWKE